MTENVPVQPGHGRAGRHPTLKSLDRKIADSAAGKGIQNDDPGLFGRMFDDLPGLSAEDGPLTELSEAMRDAGGPGNTKNNDKIPAGFTYLGQFVDHDMTLDLTSINEKIADPDAIWNFRTPALDLDSVYGLGPDGSRHLYARNAGDQDGKNPGPKLLVGRTTNAGPGNVTGDHRNDLPRSPEGFALAGDHRNDENLLVMQTHVAFLKFHNKVCDRLANDGMAADKIFSEARRIVTWHYQWIVLHDFVERLTEPGLIKKIKDAGRKLYRFSETPYMPVEFSAAVYRMGHSMVRGGYSHNRIFPGASLDQFFQFTGLSGIVKGAEIGPLDVFPSNWIVDWRRYYKLLPAQPDGVPLNLSRHLDPFLVGRLFDLPGGGGSLAFRNLKRGVMLKLPSGQDVAKEVKKHYAIDPITPEEIASGPDGEAAKKHGLHQKTPLWYYILKEAQVRGNGEKMGPVGAILLAEVFLGIVHGDHNSYLWQRQDWKPELPAETPGTFTMADMLRFVGDISPLDGVTTV